MFWILLLCHFVADYPLQTDAIVEAKKKFLGLAAHVAVHFFTMLVIMVGLLQINFSLAFPGIMVLTGLHFAIDTWKNILCNMRPSWVIFVYLQDQVLHVISIFLVALLVESALGILAGLQEHFWIIPALGMVLATHVWFITERVLFYRSSSYQQWVSSQSYPRMISRALLLGAYFLGWNMWALLVFFFGLIYHWLDLAGKFHIRALLIDVFVVVGIAAGMSFVNT